jgi:hypothetical protein
MPPSLPALGAVALLTLAAPAGPRSEVDTFTGSDSVADDRFGAAVAVDGSLAVIGAPGHNSSAGAAYILQRQRNGQWLPLRKLTASDAAVDDQFGAAVDLRGDTVLIGAPGDDAGEGAAYIFRRVRGTFVEIDKLTAEDNAADARLGASVALDRTLAIVGAPGDDSGAGAAYLFRRIARDNWDQLLKLTPNPAAAAAEFGTSVDLQADTALVGAPQASGTGAAYAFVRQPAGSWTQDPEIVPDDSDADDAFGAAVALDAGVLLIGAPGDDLEAGAAYIFVRDTQGLWTQQDKLIAEDDAAEDALGASVALRGTLALVGAPGDNTLTGSAVLFRRLSDNTWPQLRRLSASDAAADDDFGASVTLDARTALIGAPGADGDLGAGYAFR